nr:MAG TPA: STRUCTURAL MAINTENANCE OF CHROMOSOMES PROTEIN [Caudoviricetes sp.]
MSKIKINKLEIENVKRVKAVKFEPTANGITVIGGDNGQGKTSVLDSIAWALGGNKFRPSQPVREGSVIPPNLHIVMSNGLVVERKGKNSDLKVIDPDGNKAGQQLLDSFVEELALNLPKFMQQSNKEKANTLLQIIGVGEQLVTLEKEEQDAYNRRHAIGQIADQKEKFAKEQEYYPDAPKELVSASDLIKQQQEILARNGENQKKRENLASIQKLHEEAVNRVELLKRELSNAENELAKVIGDLTTASKSAKNLIDESTEELEKSITEVDEINRKVRSNLDKDKAEEDARGYREEYDELTTEITEIRKRKTALLDNADLPLEGLSVEDGDLIYNGFKWDNMSGSEQLKVATAIVRKLNPNCGFVLIDKLEQMDVTTLNAFGEWLESEGLQAIATRVSTGDECSIIIEDGYVKSQEPTVENAPDVDEYPQTKWEF